MRVPWVHERFQKEILSLIDSFAPALPPLGGGGTYDASAFACTGKLKIIL